MTFISTSTRIVSAIGLAALAVGISAAEPAPSASATQRYQQERAACLNGQAQQEREACLREAGASLQQSRRADVPGDTAQNRLARCDAQPVADRAECARRMNEGTTTGSVGGGGISRELVTRTAP